MRAGTHHTAVVTRFAKRNSARLMSFISDFRQCSRCACARLRDAQNNADSVDDFASLRRRFFHYY